MSFFVDTCVLLNYIQQRIEGDRGAREFVEGDSTITLGKVVNEELKKRFENRRHVYTDLLMFISKFDGDVEESHPVYKYEVLDSDTPHKLTESDKTHIRELQMDFVSVSNGQKLYELRRYIRSARRRKKKVESQAKEFEGGAIRDLAEEINSAIGNKNDSLMISEGVRWSEETGNDEIVTLDESDMLKKVEDINTKIKENYSDSLELQILPPNAVT